MTTVPRENLSNFFENLQIWIGNHISKMRRKNYGEVTKALKNDQLHPTIQSIEFGRLGVL